MKENAYDNPVFFEKYSRMARSQLGLAGAGEWPALQPMLPPFEGRRVLDLFAGTGQLGIECLSRGATEAVFVDRRTDAVKLIRENLKVTELTDRARVVSADSMEFLKGLREKFDIIFLDPPYAAGLLEPAIAHIAKFDILNPHGIIMAEHPVERTMPALSAPYRLHKTYRYGKIAVTMYRRSGNEQNEE